MRRVTWAALLLATTVSVPASPARADEPMPTITTVLGAPDVSGSATEVGLTPHKLLVDGNRVLVPDTSNGVIRSISNGVSEVVAGSGGRPLGAVEVGRTARHTLVGSPFAVAVQPDGTTYYVDEIQHRVMRIGTDGVVSTLAGDGLLGSGGDGLDARLASLCYPKDLAVAGDDLYIADGCNNRIRHVDLGTGLISTFAGTGTAGAAGDGGPAGAAQLSGPEGVELDGAGGLLVADTGNNKIRRIDLTSRVITTVAGDGSAGPDAGQIFGDGRYPLGDGGPAVSAQLHAPSGVTALPGGGLLIADTLHHKIRKVTPDGVISTIAGTGQRQYGPDEVAATSSELFAPEDAVLLPDGQVLVSDTRASRVRRIDSQGIIHAFAGNSHPSYTGSSGAGTSTQIGHASAMLRLADGTLLVYNSSTYVLIALDPVTGQADVVGGNGAYTLGGDNGPVSQASLGFVDAMAEGPDGSVYLATSEPGRIRKIDPSGTITTVAGTGTQGYAGDGGQALDASISPQSLAVAADGSLVFGEVLAPVVRRIDAATQVVSTIAGTTTQGSSGDGGPATAAQLSTPTSLAFDGLGRLLIADQAAGLVRRIDTDGVISTIAGMRTTTGRVSNDDGQPATSAVIRPEGIAVAVDGTLLIADLFDHRVRRVDAATGVIRTIAGTRLCGFSGDGGPAGDADLNMPTAVATDLSGGAYVLDSGNQRIRRLSGLSATPIDVVPASPDLAVTVVDGVPTAQVSGDRVELYARRTAHDSAGPSQGALLHRGGTALVTVPSLTGTSGATFGGYALSGRGVRSWARFASWDGQVLTHMATESPAVTAGEPVTLTAHSARLGTNHGPIRLQRNVSGDWADVTTATPSETGDLSVTLTPDATADYRFETAYAGVLVRTGTVTVTVSQRSTSLAPARASASTVTYSGNVQLTSRLASGSTPLPGRQVVLEQLPYGASAWSTVRTVTSTADGTVSGIATPGTRTWYRFRYAGSSADLPSTGDAVVVAVRASVSIAFSTTRASVGHSVVISGRSLPSHPSWRVYLQRRTSSGGWANVTSTGLSSTSGYRFVFTPRDHSDPVFRVFRPADPGRVSSGSRAVQLVVS